MNNKVEDWPQWDGTAMKEEESEEQRGEGSSVQAIVLSSEDCHPDIAKFESLKTLLIATNHKDNAVLSCELKIQREAFS